VRFQANGLPVVSLYCRVDPGASQREVRARVDSLLDQIRPLAKDRDLDHRYRLSVRTDIERIKDALDSERWPPGTIAIFSCSGRGLYEEIPLPRRVREQVMVDKTPLARPMLAVLGEYPRAGVLVINREAAPVWEMYQDEMHEVQTVTDPLRKAGNTGGSRPEDRIQNRVDEQAKRHFRRAASMIDQLLRSDGYDILVVGGHEYELGEFFRQDHAVAQQRKIGGSQHVPGAGDGDDDVGVRDGAIARRRAEPVQVRLKPGDGVDVDDRDPGAGAAEVSRHAASARAVAEHGDLFPVGDPVRHPQEGFDRALPDGVLVLGELLDRAVVDDQDGALELVPERLEPHPARGRSSVPPSSAS
jgi:Bacterial archaeo-eukaryotic release factor family 10